MRKRLIIINRMYAGKYLTVGENIGHEIINLIRADNGENYLWLNADGNCDKKRFIDGKTKKCYYDEIIMVMVQMYGYRQWKVLAKAQIDTENLERYMADRFTIKNHKAQVSVIDQEKICYGQQRIDTIFAGNHYDEKVNEENDLYFTFKAKTVIKPVPDPTNIKKTIMNIAGLEGLSNQSLRMYLTEDEKENTYKIFNKIIEGGAFQWEEENTTQKADAGNVISYAQKEYFLRIINEEYRELTFSNLLAYFLKNKAIMAGFAKKILKIHNFNADQYTITREEKNIDIFISSPGHMIILENKIRSGLIQEGKKMENKLLEYFGVKNKEKLPQEGKDLLDQFDENFKNEKKWYQTDRYYAYAKGVIYRNDSQATICGCVLFPNYVEHSIDEQLKDAMFAKDFRKITYKRIYDYFEEWKNSPVLTENEHKYLEEFLLAMERHTKEVDNSFEEEMQYRFYKRIQAVSGKQE